MSNRITFTAALLAGPFLAGNAWAATIEVHQGESIQAALNSAKPGDTVAVKAGTYNESVKFKGSGIKLLSVDGVGAAHIQSTGTPLFVQGGENKEVSGFKLSAGKSGNGIQLGGSVSNFASGYVIKNNIINTAGEDGIKAHQLDNSIIAENQILNAGTSNNSNHDGGIDFVAVRGTDLIGNVIQKTGGNSCLMLKGGSTDNDISGNTFAGCKNAVHVGGLTTDKFMAPGSNGQEAYGNTITGNKLASTGCAIYTFDGAENNTVSGNEISQGGGCSSAGGGGKLDATPVNYGTAGGSYGGGSYGGGSSSGGTGSQYAGMATLVASPNSGGKCSSPAMNMAMNAISGISSLFGGGRATVAAQWAQQMQLMWANQCAAEQHDRLNEQIIEQRRMTAGIGGNVAGKAGTISNGVGDTLELSTEKDMEDRYQTGASGDLSPDESLAYHKELKASTDKARRNALETAAKNAEAEKEYSKMADEALELSQSAQGQTSAIQAQTQMERAKEGADASRASTQAAFEHARLMTEEEQRAGERIGQQRRKNLWSQSEQTESPPFKLFQ
jgi:parallel beta-helix repeat protein